MIYDRFEHAGVYFTGNSLLYKAVSYASQLDPTTPDGRYDIGIAVVGMVRDGG